ncbi:MAG: hypothetical protein K5892_00710 [Acholeplasmatales bacterium]|nr:hypothetical protein [Acholeplasmatales bacterium]
MKTINEEEIKEKKSIKLKLISIFIFLFFDFLFIILSLFNVGRISNVLSKTSQLRFVFIIFFNIYELALLKYYCYILIYILYKRKKKEISYEKI